MIKRKELMRKLYKKYPRKIALKNNDYVGIMVNAKKENISNIVLCLDLDAEVIDKIPFNTDLIITHHPFLYGKSKSQILKNDALRNEWTNLLLEKNISVVSMHTNFDEANDGMNDVLVEKLALKNVYSPSKMPMMRIGELEFSLPREEFVKLVKEKLNVSYALLQGYGKSEIKKVAIIGGGGSSYFNIALEENADIYISGDAPHHIRRSIFNYRFNYLDIPHEVERVFMNKMKAVLLKIDNTLNITIIDHEQEAKVF